MRKATLLFFLLFLCSCGALSVSPLGCRSEGSWGDGSSLGGPVEEMKLSEEYYVWNDDYEVRLKDFLKRHHVNCSEVKKLRVQINSVFFVKRELNIFIVR
ncbi:MAG: hypothetical protein ACXVLQ_13280 [Bacteriovorax sp.]